MAPAAVVMVVHSIVVNAMNATGASAVDAAQLKLVTYCQSTIVLLLCLAHDSDNIV